MNDIIPTLTQRVILNVRLFIYVMNRISLVVVKYKHCIKCHSFNQLPAEKIVLKGVFRYTSSFESCKNKIQKVSNFENNLIGNINDFICFILQEAVLSRSSPI